MTDTFSKACLGLITLSLMALAYVQVAEHMTAPVKAQPSPTKQVAMSPSACISKLSELKDTERALQQQLKNIPAMVQEKDAEGTLVSQKPNRLYVQLMNQVIDTRTQQATLMDECG